MEPGSSYTVNGRFMDSRRHTYIKHAVEKLWPGPPLQIVTYSKIPSASGLGSSAAITTASVACVLTLQQQFSLEEVARKSFAVEYEVQRGGSPNDTSACTLGSAIIISQEQQENCVWSISHKDKTWHVHSITVPNMDIVVGITGIKSKTPQLVRKVRRFVDYSGFARELTESIGAWVGEGIKALHRRDYVLLGEAMTESQKILHTLGASSPELEKLIQASLRAGAYGAKLTGAGGGGSMIAITDEPEKVAIAIKKAGGQAMVTSVSLEGTKVWP
jgi:mevalonate kinase